MITAYHSMTDYTAAEFLAVNPFAPLVQTAARLRGCDRSPRPRKESPTCPSRPPIHNLLQRITRSLIGRD